MIAVGIRELKSNLSQYLRKVRNGESVLVTDRGQVIAEIGPAGALRSTVAQNELGLTRLMRFATVTHSGVNDASVYRRTQVALPRGTARRLIDEERGS